MTRRVLASAFLAGAALLGAAPAAPASACPTHMTCALEQGVCNTFGVGCPTPRCERITYDLILCY